MLRLLKLVASNSATTPPEAPTSLIAFALEYIAARERTGPVPEANTLCALTNLLGELGGHRIWSGGPPLKNRNLRTVKIFRA
jgi:hypothetical protein